MKAPLPTETKAARLHHVWCEPLAKFLARIDEFGGWPVGKKYVSFAHNDERECEFGNDYLRTGWWTTICDSDEYYRWKLSPQAIIAIKREVAGEIGATVMGYYR